MALSSLLMPFIVVVITSTGSSNGYTCGVSTAFNFGIIGGKKTPVKWKKTELTYVIDNINTLSKQISRTVVAREVARAFKSWSDVTNLSFTRVNSKKADIRISSHGRNTLNDFNGRTDTALSKCTSEKCVFAHAYKPYDGRLHFNDLVSWTIVDPNIPDRRKADKTDLYTIALHEIGHTLGLDHEEKDKSALMYPKIDKNVRKELSKDDRDGIQALYGKPRELRSYSAIIKLSAQNLEDEDTSIFSKGHSDPFFEMFKETDNGQWARAHKSEIVSDNGSPKWKQFRIPLVRGDKDRKVKIELRDHDKFVLDEELGTFIIPMRELKRGAVFDSRYEELGRSIVEYSGRLRVEKFDIVAHK